MKTVKMNFKVLIVSILSFLCFTLSAKSTAELKGHSHVETKSMDHFCEDCGANSWEVYIDVNNHPYYAICAACHQCEYILDEDGNFLFRIYSDRD